MSIVMQIFTFAYIAYLTNQLVRNENYSISKTTSLIDFKNSKEVKMSDTGMTPYMVFYDSSTDLPMIPNMSKLNELLHIDVGNILRNSKHGLTYSARQ